MGMITKYYDRYAPADELVISNFDGGAGVEWSVIIGTGTLSEESVGGESGFKLTVGPNEGSNIEKLVTMDASTYDFLRIRLHHSDWFNASGLRVYVGDSSNRWHEWYTPAEMQTAGMGDDNYANKKNSGFFDCILDLSNPTSTINGNIDYASIDKVRLRVNSSAGELGGGMLFTRMSFIKNTNTKGVFLFCNDDPRAEFYTTAVPILKAAGLKCTSFISKSFIDAGEWTLAQCRELQDVYGWCMASHSLNHINAPDMTDEEFENDCKQQQEWMRENGLKDYRIHAWPFGGYDSANLKIAKKYFDFARNSVGSGRGRPHTRFQPLEIIKGPGENDTPAVLDYIDQIVATKRMGCVLYHGPGWGWTAAEFQQVVDKVKGYVDAGTLDCLTFSEYLARLSITGITSDTQNVYVQGEGFLGKDGNANPNAVKLGGAIKTPSYITDTQMVIPR